jgi:hypothetical protein
MNKTQKILACEGNIKYECIQHVVGCSPQMVYSVLNSMLKGEEYKPKHKGRINETSPKTREIQPKIFRTKFKTSQLR